MLLLLLRRSRLWRQVLWHQVRPSPKTITTNITRAVRRRTRLGRRRVRCRIRAARCQAWHRTVRRPAQWAVRIRQVRRQRWFIRWGRRPAPPREFSYHGHDFERVHVHPFIYPPGFAYRRWEVGAALPPAFLVRDYWYADWAALGLDPPPPGYQWVRYGPDLLLVNVVTGQVAEVTYDVFYE